jgi:dihydrofolate reductase
MRPTYTLIVVATADGFIARTPGHSPAGWASPEEQALFFAEVDAADWGVMGRTTHEAAPRPDRRRIVLSTTAPVPAWRTPTQVWLDPATVTPDDLSALVAPVRGLRHGLILGGGRVHGWFHDHARIDRVLLTVEPVRFGDGLALFPGHDGPPEEVLDRLGYAAHKDCVLNAGGTRLIEFHPR